MPMQRNVEPLDHPLPFSVIIPARNEERNIGRCLEALRQMNFPRESFEVIFVDNGSTDRTVELVESFQNVFSLHILKKANVYIAAVRNAGAAVARGRWYAFLDADCEVRPDWLNRASKSVAEGIKGGFGSFYLIPEKSTWIARQWHEAHEKKPAGETPYLPSGDLFISAEIFHKVGGFDETIQTNEDFELCQRIRGAGLPIVCVPELGVIHWGTPQTLKGFYRKNRWHGMHVFQVFLKNLPALYNFKAVALAAYTLFCLLGILAAAVVGLKYGSYWLFGAFLAAFLAPSILLGIRQAVSRRRLSAAIPMTALYLTYGLARASCLLVWKNWAPAFAHKTQEAKQQGTTQ